MGWHGGWCWRRVTPRLRAAGHEVATPTLTGLGDRAHLAQPLGDALDLDTHIRDVVGLLEYEDLRDVVAVGHSYAGTVLTGAAGVAGVATGHDAMVTRPDEVAGLLADVWRSVDAGVGSAQIRGSCAA